MKKRILRIAACFIATAAIGFTACKKNDSTPDPDPVNDPKTGVLLGSNSTFGQVLTDSSGRSLYFFAPDVQGESACTGNCEVIWPPFHTSATISVEGLNAADFGTINRADGSKQTTYKGWPLYYYQSDAAAGEIKGDKVGNVWFVAKPDYSVMIGRTQLVGNDGKNYTGQLQEGTGASTFITDDRGRTLYAFSPDHKNKNNFTREDFSNNAIWPIYEGTPAKVPSVLNAADFSETDVFGKKQISFKGWPTYYFGPDAMKQGVTKGVSIPNWQIMYGELAAAPL
ncbi:MAG: hypothetical protein INR69_02625 [Mucilaginibacter polytrichastri]|nr:hypothetical protein [Mucilaginibacter polytrichastri]